MQCGRHRAGRRNHGVTVYVVIFVYMKRNSYIFAASAVLIWICVYTILYVIAPAVPSFDTRSIMLRGKYLLPMVSGLLLLFTTLFILSVMPFIKLTYDKILVGLFLLVIIDRYSSKLDSTGYIWSFLVSDISIIFIGVLLGKLLANQVRHRSWIIPIALVAMVADIWSVSYGPAYYITTQPPQVMRHFLLFYPLLGATTIEATTIPYWLRPFIGMGDVIFLALYLELTRKFELHTLYTRISMAVAMLVPISLASYAEKGIPALPFMSAMFIFLNFRYLELRKKELVQCAIFIAVLVVILLIIYLNPVTRDFLSLER